MPKLQAERVKDKPGALKVTMCYSTTIFEDFLKSEPEAQKDILRRDMQQAALDVINSTDFTDVEIIDEQGDRKG